MPDVVREDSHKNQGKHRNTAKMFHYTPAPPQSSPPENQCLARYVANVFSPYCSSWAKVYPAAGLPALAKQAGAGLVIINREQTDLDHLADLVINGEIGPTLAATLDW